MQKPFEADSCEFVLWLSRAEWQLVHGLSFAWMVQGLMPDLAMVPAYRHVIAELQREHGYEFDGLTVDADGELWRTRETPVCAENVLSLQLMQSGSAPDLLVHVPAAIEYAERRVPGLDLEPLRQVRDELETKLRQIRERRRDLSPELKERIRETLRERAAALQPLKDLI